MKIKFNFDDDLPLNKTLKLFNMIIFVRSVFHEGSKYYPVFLDESFYELEIIEKCYIMIELTFLKVLMLIKKCIKRGYYLSLLVYFRWMVWVSTRCLQWVSWCVNHVYKP